MYVIWKRLRVIEGKIIALMPLKVKKPVLQKPKSTTSPLPKEGRTPKITENKYINNIPITKVGSETPNKEIAYIVSLKNPFRFIPV